MVDAFITLNVINAFTDFEEKAIGQCLWLSTKCIRGGSTHLCKLFNCQSQAQTELFWIRCARFIKKSCGNVADARSIASEAFNEGLHCVQVQENHTWPIRDCSFITCLLSLIKIATG